MQYALLEGITLDSPSEMIVRWMGDRLSASQASGGLIGPGEVSGLAAIDAADPCPVATTISLFRRGLVDSNAERLRKPDKD